MQLGTMQQCRQHTNTCHSRLHRPSVSQCHSVVCAARRTGGGTEKETKSGSTTSSLAQSSNKSSNSSSSPNQPPRPGQRNNKQQPSQLEKFVRTTPGLNRFLDGTLLLGDMVMVLATEVASERLPLEQMPALAAVAVASWVVAGAALGDYAMIPDPDANPLSNALGWPIFQAVVNSMITWAVAMVLSIVGFTWLVSHFMVEPEMVLELTRDGMLSPQLEISVALLITMSCWRGMAARLRL